VWYYCIRETLTFQRFDAAD